MSETVIGVDIGGTKVAAGRVDSSGAVSGVTTVPTLAGEPLAVSLAQVYAAIEHCLSADVQAIGLCAPGPLNPKTGVVINPPNLPYWRNVPLADLVKERFGLPCRVENDANAAGLAEVLFGAARGMESVLYVTLSTGIGAGIILGGKVYHGKNGAAAEGGHVTIDWRSPAICNCGVPGCIEVLASGTAMAANAARRGLPAWDAKQIGDAAQTGNNEAIEILDETSRMISAWLGSLISLLDPDMIVIGGGVSRIAEPLFRRLRDMTPRRTINQFANETPIIAAMLQENVGVVGAAATVFAL